MEKEGLALERARGKAFDRLRDDCIAILVRLVKCRRVPISEIAAERGLSERTIYRWVNSFSFVIPVVVRSGVVIIGDDDDFQKLQKLSQLKIFSKE